MSKSELPYGATHSVWSRLRSPYLLLRSNKRVYQIEKKFDAFSTVLDAVERNDTNNSNLVNGLAACCEVNSKSIREIAADRMFAKKSKQSDADRAFDLYS